MKLPGHGQGRALDVHVPDLLAVPLAPEECVDVPVAEALDGGGHLALEGEAAHLAVRHHVEAGRFLERERLVDCRVLSLIEGGLCEGARLELFPRFEQGRGPQQAADDVCAGQEHETTLEAGGYHSRFASRRGWAA